eukprot:GHVR01081911.1.p1 GENE.GHVR01081911.1~~GHVR01081911.1.p1  ORF type:complete len:120 (-),score=17.92 GHVR01081911.1:324-683(-)
MIILWRLKKQRIKDDEVSDFEWEMTEPDINAMSDCSVSPSHTSFTEVERSSAPVSQPPQFVLARTMGGAVYPAQVVKRARLQLASLKRGNDGIWQYKEMIYPTHKAIVQELKKLLLLVC